jgi:nucleotide-binding universal stress UspA family protein
MRDSSKASSEPVFERVVACLDGSALGERALPHALAVARALGAPLTLLRVLERAPTEQALPDPFEWELRRKEARDYLERVIARAAADRDRADVDGDVVEGKAADEICRFGADRGVDLTVATTHGTGGPSPWTLASTARKLLERAPGSLLIVPAKIGLGAGGLRYRTVVVPLDGSAGGETAFPLATRIAHAHEAELLLAHVVPVAELTEIGPLDAEDVELVERVRARNERVARLYLDRVRARLSGLVKARIALLPGGDVASRLAQLVSNEHADLVVMAAHGRSPRRNTPCGSATTELIARLSVPLLIVRPRPPRSVRRAVSVEVRPPALAAS